MTGDGVARGACVERVDRISLLFLASSVFLLTGVALAIPAEPAELGSMCRSRPPGATTKPIAASSTPGPVRLDTTRTSP
jgi:hypothetical protein